MKKLIYILEDNDDLRDLYGYIFQEENFDYRTFATVTSFMEKVGQVPDLYLLDVMLPDGDGITLCQELQQNPASAKVPVIMVSAHKDPAEVARRCPHATFLPKPFDIQQMVELVNSRL